MKKIMPKKKCSSLGTIFNDLFDHLTLEYGIVDKKEWKVKPFLNQREFKKEKNKVKSFRKQATEKKMHTFSDLIIFVDLSKKTIYVLDGGQRMAKRSLFLASLYRALQEMNEENDCTSLYDSTFEKLRKLFMHKNNDSIRKYESNFEFLCENDKNDFGKILDCIFIGYNFTKEDQKSCMIKLFEDEIANLKRLLKNKKLSEYIDECINHLEYGCYLGFDDYTNSGLSPQTIYTDVVLTNSEHTNVEKFEAAFIAPLNNSKNAVFKADEIRDQIWKITSWIGEKVLKSTEKRKIYFHNLALTTCPDFELCDGIDVENEQDLKNVFKSYVNVRINSRPTMEDDRTTLSIDNGSAVEYVKEYINSLERATFFYKYEELMKNQINEYCNKMNNFKILFNPALNKNWIFADLALSAVNYMKFRRKGSASDNDLNEMVGLILNALTLVLISPASISTDAQMSNKILTEFIKKVCKADVNKKASDIMKETLSELTNALSADGSLPDRTLPATTEIKKIIEDVESDFYNVSARKSALKLMVFRYKEDASFAGNVEWITASDATIEHIIAQDYCAKKDNPNEYAKYIHCAGNLTLLSSDANSIAGDKPVEVKLSTDEVAKHLSEEEKSNLYPQLKAAQDAQSILDYRSELEIACKMVSKMLNKYFEL